MTGDKVIFTSIDQYIGTFPEEVQNILEEIRTTIKAIAPDAKEKISYQIPCFELNGRNLIHFAGWNRHISMYPVPTGDEAFEKKIAKYVAGRGTLKFPLDEPIPLELIGEVVKFRVAGNLENVEKKARK
jgi:uncharacterized protein YdhG (YjbR/CyaY superfamily)